MGRAGRGHRQIPVARRQVNVRTAQDEEFHIVPPLHRRGASSSNRRQHHHLLAVRATPTSPTAWRPGGILRTLRLLAVEALRAPSASTLRFAGLNGHRHTIWQTRRRRNAQFAATHGGPGAILHHVTLAYDIDAGKKDDPRVEHLTRENVRQSGEIGGQNYVDPMRSQTGMGRDEGSGATWSTRRRSRYPVLAEWSMVPGLNGALAWMSTTENAEARRNGGTSMVTPNGTNGINGFGGFDDKNVRRSAAPRCSSRFRPKKPGNCCRICCMPNTTRAISSSARETPTIACICWRKAASN